jgi:single-strand DNA-binding protein
MLNKVFLIGNLGQDPELINSGTVQARCTFSLATEEFKKGEDGEGRSVTSWHNIVSFGPKADVAAGKLKKRHLL